MPIYLEFPSNTGCVHVAEYQTRCGQSDPLWTSRHTVDNQTHCGHPDMLWSVDIQTCCGHPDMLWTTRHIVDIQTCCGIWTSRHAVDNQTHCGHPDMLWSLKIQTCCGVWTSRHAVDKAILLRINFKQIKTCSRWLPKTVSQINDKVQKMKRPFRSSNLSIPSNVVWLW